MREARYELVRMDSTGVYTVLVVRPEGKRQFGRPGCRRENNIKMDLSVSGMGTWTGFCLRIGVGGGLLWMR